MGWIERLCETYDACMCVAGERIEGEPILIPVAHSTANAQIEVFVSEDGDFIDASVIEKDGLNEVTVIPVTEDSATRTAGNSPHPLHDKLCYVAGDYVRYTDDDKRMQYYKEYMDFLKKWVESEYSCSYIMGVYKYLEKGCLIEDLERHGILVFDDFLHLSEEIKIHNLPQSSAFVRFGIIDSSGEAVKGWLDKELYALYQKYYIPQVGYDDICFASGLQEKCTIKHPNKIRNSGDKAKIISGNDSAGFTFRGRFSTKEQAASVGYVASQKAHNALRWLIQRQGYQKDGSAIVIWNIPANTEKICYENFGIPDVYSNSYYAFNNNEEIGMPDTGQETAIDIRRAIYGYNSSITDDSRIIMMSVDAATQGRMSIEYYHEFSGNEFLDNLRKWHGNAAVMRLIKDHETKEHIYTLSAPSAREIALAAYGTDRGGYLGADDIVIKNAVKRILPCIIGLNKNVPKDILRSVLQKLERPQAYNAYVWNNHIYPVACSLLKYEGYFNKGESEMDEAKERSLIWGRLLAVLDEVESRAMYFTGKNITDDRLTNAKKAWNKFVRRPMTAYEQIYRIVLQAYMKRLPRETREYLEYELNRNIIRLQELNGFTNEPLKPEYLVGYQEQKMLMKNGKKKEEDTE